MGLPYTIWGNTSANVIQFGQNARLIRGSSVVRVHTFAPNACLWGVEDSLAEELMPKLAVVQPIVKEWGKT